MLGTWIFFSKLAPKNVKYEHDQQVFENIYHTGIVIRDLGLAVPPFEGILDEESRFVPVEV